MVQAQWHRGQKVTMWVPNDIRSVCWPIVLVVPNVFNRDSENTNVIVCEYAWICSTKKKRMDLQKDELLKFPLSIDYISFRVWVR